MNKKYFLIVFLSLSILLCNAQKLSTPSSLYYDIINNDNGNEDKILAIEQSLNKLFDNKDFLQYGIDLTAFSFWLYQNGYLNKAISKSEKAVKFYETYTPQDTNFYLKNLYLLGRLYAKDQNYSDSNHTYFKIIKEKHTKTTIGEVYQNIAKNYNAEGNYHTATSYFQKAIKEFKKENKYQKLFSTTISLSQNYHKILDDSSIKKGIENLKNLDSLKNKIDFNEYQKYLINETLGNLHNYENLFEPDICLPYYNKALSIAKELEINQSISIIYNNIGHIYREIDNETALNYFREALKYSKKNDIDNARSLYSIGLTHLDQKNYSEAYNYFESSLNKLKPKKTDIYL